MCACMPLQCHFVWCASECGWTLLRTQDHEKALQQRDEWQQKYLAEAAKRAELESLLDEATVHRGTPWLRMSAPSTNGQQMGCVA